MNKKTTNKKRKFSIKEVYLSLSYLDLGCCWYDILKSKHKNIMGFCNDDKGNDNGPYLELKFLREYVKINSGDFLTKKEKKITFCYSDYNSVDDFADDLGEFVRKYFNSFKLVRATR